MRDIPDDELDAFFKKSSGNYPIDFDPGAWQRMEKRLDQAYRRTLVLRTTLAILVVAALLLILFLATDRSGNQPAKQPEEAASASPLPQPGTIQDKGQAAPKEIAGAERAAPTPDETRPAAAQVRPSRQPDTGALASTGGEGATASSVKRPHKSESPPGFVDNSQTHVVHPAKPVPAGNTGTATQHPAGVAVGREKPVNQPGALPAGEGGPTKAGERSFATINPPATGTGGTERKTLPEPAAPGADTLVTETGGPKSKNAVAVNPDAADSPRARQHDTAATEQGNGNKRMAVYRFSLSLTVAPDLSSVGFSRLASPGSNVGMLLEYHLNDRISLSGGLLYGTKVYTAGPEDYTPDYGLWSYGRKPTRIDAVCKVLDLPLNIRYTFRSEKKHRLFVTTGFSTYLMRDERYAYAYDVPNDYLIQSWRVRNGSRHAFSVLNLSAGYERSLHERLSLQAEPFVKVPLAGVGFGKVKLASAGVFFSLKYHFDQR